MTHRAKVVQHPIARVECECGWEYDEQPDPTPPGYLYAMWREHLEESGALK